ncbi:N-methyl-L-tryptophan oxidase [Pseudonocardia spinosispora]|uniref:N-methyl-L-tryptophan oxidase n=1 Tax=Pseudonocardia spinosispora TaxID=103441 RepID=UPI0003FF34CD|nr:N-methyl-L-tryptophan oxidase [Pseudonocardia spinosispora]
MTTTLDAEVGVIGVGTVGSMLMWRLARRGVAAIGFERYAPGHDRGAVGGETRLFRMAYAEGARYGELLRSASSRWRELEAESGAALLVQCGGLAIGDPGHDYIGGLLASASAAGVPVEVLDRAETHDRFPRHVLRAREVSVLDRQAGFIRCEPAVLAAVETAERHGATVLRHTEVDAVTEHAGHVEIRTGEGSWRVREAVVCAGSWSTRLLPARWRAHLQPRRVPLSWFAARRPSEFAPDRFPIFIHRVDDVEIYGAPTVDGVSVKVAGGVVSNAVDDPDRIERRHDRADVSTMSRLVGELVDGLVPDPIRTDTFTDLYSRDGTPVVGRLGAGSRLLVASGFSGRGFKYSPALASVVADCLVGGTEVPLDFMRPERLLAT